MRSSAIGAISPRVIRALRQFGSDISLARRKRAVTMQMMSERASVSLGTYRRIERGDPNVAFGLYIMALQGLGLDVGAILRSVMPEADTAGLLLDRERVPKRVRPKHGGAL